MKEIRIFLTYLYGNRLRGDYTGQQLHIKLTTRLIETETHTQSKREAKKGLLVIDCHL